MDQFLYYFPAPLIPVFAIIILIALAIGVIVLLYKIIDWLFHISERHETEKAILKELRDGNILLRRYIEQVGKKKSP